LFYRGTFPRARRGFQILGSAQTSRPHHFAGAVSALKLFVTSAQAYHPFSFLISHSQAAVLSIGDLIGPVKYFVD
jgi:hypothetical protein